MKVIILAAGLGARMKSALPKVLHPLGGKPLLRHVVDAAQHCHPEQIIIIHGEKADLLQSAIPDATIQWVLQSTPCGTADAVSKALPLLNPHDQVLILYGDVPLISPETLQHLLQQTPAHEIGLLTAIVDDPTGFGRIIRDAQHQVTHIVEEKDATPQERTICEMNTGICTLSAAHLQEWLGQIQPHNAQGEYYLTDIFALAAQLGVKINTAHPQSSSEILGVNDRAQLAQLNQIYQQQQALRFLKAGVGIVDPSRWQLRGNLQASQDTFIDVNVILEGNVILQQGASIGPNCVIKDCVVGENSRILANSHCEGAVIGNNVTVGPFARLRPGTHLKDNVHIGNFVEIKNTTIDERSKVNHLSYIGDATLGKEVNIGAGTITCNYDGVNKHQTIIEDGVHIGSDTQLIAPITVGKSAVIAAGSTLTQDAPAHALTLTHRLEQRTQARKPRTTDSSTDNRS